MAFVRKVRTASGATAVQVVEKRHGKLAVIEHIGSAHTVAELGLLMGRAEEVLRAGQGVLDLGLEVPVREESLLDAPEPAARLFDTWAVSRIVDSSFVFSFSGQAA